MSKACILMADVIGSRKKNSKALMNSFKLVIAGVNRKNRKCLLSPLTITLGDEFQGIVKDIATAATIIINIEEEIIKLNTDFKLRYVLQYGEVDNAINKKIAYEMLGGGLTSARNNLIAAKKNKTRRVFFFLQKQEDASLMENLFFVFTSIKDSWRPSDYYLISGFMELKKYNLVAQKLSKEASLIWKREKTLMIKQYFAIKESIIETVNRLK